jgi:hypothetical protein
MLTWRPPRPSFRAQLEVPEDRTAIAIEHRRHLSAVDSGGLVAQENDRHDFFFDLITFFSSFFVGATP